MGMQDTLRALADPTRREILNLLKKSRLSAGEIGDHFSISGAAVSRHLEGGRPDPRRAGRKIHLL